MFMDHGHKLIIVKELSKNPNLLVGEYLVHKISIKLVTFLFVFCLLQFYGYTNDYWGYSPIVICLVSFSGLCLALTNINVSIFHSNNKYIYETLTLVVFSFILGLALIGSRFTSSEVTFLFGYMVGSMLMLLVSSVLLKKKIKNISFKSILSKINVKGLVKEMKIVLPFSSIVIIEALFGQFDILLVENYCSKLDLGLYSGVKKVLAGLGILMLISSSALMPMLSRMSKIHTLKAKLKILGIFGSVTILGTILFVTYYLFNDVIIELLLGHKYAIISEWDTQIALLTLSMYVRIVPGIYLVTSDHEYKRLFITSVGLIIGTLYFLLYLPGNDYKFAVKAITHVKVGVTIFYVLIFLLVLFGNRIRKLHPSIG